MVKISVLIPRALLSVVDKKLPGSRARLLERAKLSGSDLALETGRVQQSRLSELWLAAADITQDPQLGLHVGECLEAGSLGLFEYIVTNGATLRDALRQFLNYGRLVNDMARCDLEEDAEEARFIDLPPPDLATAFYGVEMLFAAMANRLKSWGLEFRVHRVCLKHSFPGGALSEYERVFGCAVRFDQPRNELVFLRSQMDLPLKGADPNLQSLLTRVAERDLESLPPSDSLAKRVEHVIRNHIRKGQPLGLAVLARELRMSERHLQRRLAELSSSYQSLLDQVRRDLAVEFLTQSDEDVERIAYRLGFAEASSFIRFFRREFGESPGKYQRSRKSSELTETAP